MLGGMDDSRIDIPVKQEEGCNVQSKSAVTITRFYNQVVFSNIHNKCGRDVFELGKCNSSRLTLVTCRH
jgi:hypothetical protein